MFRAIPKKILGGSASSEGPVMITHFSDSRRALRPPLCVWGGHRQPRGAAKQRDCNQRWVEQVFFPVPVCP
jgi:hypothetical protein